MIIGKKFKLKSEKVIFVGVFFCLGGLQAESVLGAMNGLNPTPEGFLTEFTEFTEWNRKKRQERIEKEDLADKWLTEFL